MPKKVNKKFFISFSFNSRKKMPTSLTTSDLQLDKETASPNTGVVIKRKLKKTTQMVDEALIELHTAKGVTIKQIYSFILNNYNLESLSHARIGLIKKHIIALRDSNDIINKTGRGFIGHLKLVDKKEFIKKLKTNMQLAKERYNATKRLAKQNSEPNTTNKTKRLKNSSAKSNFKKTSLNTELIAPPVIPRQVTPPLPAVNNVSMFDTPMVPTQVHASTPFIRVGHIPPAPAVTQTENRKRPAADELGTPRTSLPGKKRRLLKRLE
ncbi:uncharacterized protein LOC119606576 [Lucilia sericata]|uniref:uncharacterized protein LOC119606576 n=1 Tax=Lucilia sericata TaxID=13632 RepID=UPI0018A85F65|nr:uncharacterized protein LOC119606576 [Lucilia sericata]